jgi:hypothetical protein
MRVAIIFQNKIVENVIISENLEMAKAFLPTLYPDTTEDYTVLDAETEKINGVGCQLIDGIWEDPYSVAVLGWDYIRNERNKELMFCDWTQLPDSALTDDEKTEWAKYRQALRDLPTSTKKPKQVVFPTPPTIK